jgi:hypothetical protein
MRADRRASWEQLCVSWWRSSGQVPIHDKDKKVAEFRTNKALDMHGFLTERAQREVQTQML